MQYPKISQLLVLLIFPMLLIAQSKLRTSAQLSIVSPVSLKETGQLGFGNFAVKKNGGSIQLTPNGERIVNGDIQLLVGDVEPAVFRFSGNLYQVVSLKLPDVPIQLHNEVNDQSIMVDLFVSNLPVGGRGLFNQDNSFEVKVGATINIGKLTNNPRGVFTGVYDAVFTFN